MKIPLLFAAFACMFQAGSALGAEDAPAAAPRIAFESLVFDFGRIPSGEVVRHDFIFTNTGTARLEIADVHPGCGCTTAGSWDKSVEPGKTGKIPLQFNSSGFGGMVAKSASVTCNDPAHPTLTLQLTGTVWKPIDIMPSMAVFNVPGDSDQPQTKTIRIVSNLDEPLTVSNLECTNKQFDVALKTNQPGREYEVVVTARPPFAASNLMAPITANTSYEKMPVLNMNAYLIVQQPVLVMPGQIILSGPVTNSSPYVITVRSQSTNRLEVSDAKVSVPGAQVQISEAQPGRIINLSVTLPPGFQMKPGERAEVTARTSHPRHPNITVPIIQVPAFPPAAQPPRPLSAGPVVPRLKTLNSRTTTNQPAR